MRLSPFLVLLGGTALLTACAGSHATTNVAPRGFWRPNRSNRHGLAVGRWRTYYDDANKQPFTAGRYRHGRPVRTFYYYDPTGKLDHSELYGREGRCEVTYWHPGGQVARRGSAQWVTGKGKAPRFYWYGPWTSYAEDGQITSVQQYTDGALTRTETYEAGQLSKVEAFEKNKLTRLEIYEKGHLLKTESYENGRRTSSTDAL